MTDRGMKPKTGTTSGTWVSPSNEELIGSYAGGDEEAFTMLIDRVGAGLFGFIRRYIANPHRAEDVYQTVLIKLATNAGVFDNRAKFNTWMYQIARNACFDSLRKASNRLKPVSAGVRDDDSEQSSPLDVISDASEQPLEKLSREELGELIGKAVDSLPKDQKEVFLLKEEGGLTFEDIGELLGCGKETAKSRMRYAIQKLQNSLGIEARLYGLSGSN